MNWTSTSSSLVSRLFFDDLISPTDPVLTARLTRRVDDYERHLAEPTRKVREDVEKEYAPKIAKLESALESKRIWANRLDENIRAVTVENKDLQQVRPAFCTLVLDHLALN